MTGAKRGILALATLAALASLDLAGCAHFNKTEKGAVIGAGAGAAAGAVIGHVTGNTARGAIIGAAVGGAAGAVIGHQMDQQAKQIEATVPGATVTRVGEGMVVSFPSGLLYDFDSSALRPAAQDNLQKLAQSLKQYPNENVLIIGHTDSVGTESYNQALSERRARSAATYLESIGVAPARLATKGMGETDPIASNATADGRQQNRRIEIALYANEAWKRQAAAANPGG